MGCQLNEMRKLIWLNGQDTQAIITSWAVPTAMAHPSGPSASPMKTAKNEFSVTMNEDIYLPYYLNVFVTISHLVLYLG